jgi:hypothetical protein
MAVSVMLHNFHIFQYEAVNVDVVSRVTEYKIIEQVRKKENLPTDA